MIKNNYRLEEYIITEYDESLFTWEMNMVLGEHRIGNCFINGNILLIEPWDNVKDGWLKLEFNEYLMKLPDWRKTRYYCFSHSLREAATNRNLSNYFNRQKGKITIESDKMREAGIFRLNQYKITIEKNMKISWQIYEGLNKIRGGPCHIESGILFIDPETHTFYEKQSKRDWNNRLRFLPKWDKTFAWGHWNILRTCPQGKKIKKAYPIVWNLEHLNTCITDDTSNQKKTYQAEQVGKLLSTTLDHFKNFLSQPARWRFLRDKIFFMILGCLRFGFDIFLSFLRKTIYWLNKIKTLLRRLK